MNDASRKLVVSEGVAELSHLVIAQRNIRQIQLQWKTMMIMHLGGIRESVNHRRNDHHHHHQRSIKTSHKPPSEQRRSSPARRGSCGTWRAVAPSQVYDGLVSITEQSHSHVRARRRRSCTAQRKHNPKCLRQKAPRACKSAELIFFPSKPSGIRVIAAFLCWLALYF